MIITKKYAKRLIKQGKASEAGKVYPQGRENEHYCQIYMLIIRHDLSRSDHYPV